MSAGILYALLFVSLYFEVFMLLSFLEYLVEPKSTTASNPKKLPSVAIIVPCFNEEKTVALTLRSLLALDYPRELLSIIVVDDGSRDATLAVARSFTEPQIQVFTKENGGKHTAMNYGLAHTTADLIGCLDADSEVEPQSLRAVVPAFGNPKIAAVTPAILVRSPETLLQFMQNAEYRISLFSRFMLARLGSTFITPGPFSIFRTDVVRALGGWKHAHSTEDMEIAMRIQGAGYAIANAPRAVVHTTTPRTLRALVHQRTRWAYGGIRNMIDFRHMIGNRSYGNLGLFILPLSLISIGTGMIFFMLMLYHSTTALIQWYIRYSIVGWETLHLPTLFYTNTNAMLFIIWTSIVLVLCVIMAGSWIGTGSRKLPKGLVAFVLLYSFVAPLWLFTATVRVAIGKGVRWR